MNLKKFRRRQVDYEYMNNLFSLFQEDVDSQEFKRELLPFCNYITQDLYRKYPASTENDYEEFFLDVVSVTLRCIKRRKPEQFDSPNAFFVYMKKSVWLDARNLILKNRINESYNPEDLYDDVPEEKKVYTDIRDTINFQLHKRRIIKFYEEFIKIYKVNERQVLLEYFYHFIEEKDRSKESKAKVSLKIKDLNQKYGVLITKIKDLDKTSKIITKIAMMKSINEDFSIQEFPIKRVKNTKMYDKFFLVLSMLDKYPYLMELYSMLGKEKFLEFLQVFGGVSVNIPKISVLKRAIEEVETYVETLEEDSEKYVDNNKTDLTVGKINSTSKKVNTKLKSIFKDAYRKE